MNSSRHSAKRSTFGSGYLPFAGVFLILFFLCGTAVTGYAGENTPRLTTLTDGVRLILLPEPQADRAVVSVFVRTGLDAAPQEAATGALVARALFYGSQNRSLDAIADSVRRVGGSLETLRAPDYLAVTCVTSGTRLREAAYLIAEALKNADFEPDALNRARREIRDEAVRRADNDLERAKYALRNTLRPLPEPDPEALRRVTTEQALAYFHRRCLPQNTVIVVAGRFSSAVAVSTFDNNLADYDRAAPPARTPLNVEPLPPAPITAALVLEAKSDAAYALAAVPSPPITSADYPAYCVLHVLLGAGHASRLFERLRSEQGLGYDVAADYRADLSDPMIAYVQWSGKRGANPAENRAVAQNALDRLTAEIAKLTAEPPTEAELARARAVAAVQDAMRHERLQERAFLLGWYETLGLGYRYDAEFAVRLSVVSREDILRAAKTYLAAPRRALVLPPK